MRLLVMVLATAFLIDCLLGDPVYPLHPVRGIGLLIRMLEHVLRRFGLTGMGGGFVLLASVVVVDVAVYGMVRFGLARVHVMFAIAFDTFVLYSCLALKDMVRHALPIARALDREDLPRARELVQKIVGRDASLLDIPGIARATVESVAESFVDGFLAPVFWFIIFGVTASFVSRNPLPFAVAGVIIYRSINTLDSMVGYCNPKYARFGCPSARTDDILNFIPARLSLPLFVPAAFACGLDVRSGWHTALRDRLKHASPNSAHAESFLAGALGLRLGGPTAYSYRVVDKPWLGSGTNNAQSAHITQSCRLVMCAGGLWTIILLIAGYAFTAVSNQLLR